MSGINYTVFVNPSGVARNIFILFVNRGRSYGAKSERGDKERRAFWITRKTCSPRELVGDELLPCTKLFEKNPASPEGKGITGLFARGTSYPTSSCSVLRRLNVRLRERRDILLAATLAPRIISLHERVYPTRTRSNREKKHSESLLHRFCCA